MLPDPDASLVIDPPGPILLSGLWGVKGARGETHPLTLWVSYCLSYSRTFYRPGGLGSGHTAQTGPVVAG